MASEPTRCKTDRTLPILLKAVRGTARVAICRPGVNAPRFSVGTAPERKRPAAVKR